MGAEFIGRNLIYLHEVDSTNSYASALLKNVKPPEGTMIRTGSQTQGRGQRGKAWKAQQGLNLTLSYILYPQFLPLREQHFLYKISALACADTIAGILEPGQFDIRIKWPNDILVDKKKICGILIENNLQETELQSAVVGIGMNVNQLDFTDLPAANSLRALLEQELDLLDLCKSLCLHFENWYLRLKQGEQEQITENYVSRLFGHNEWLDFDRKGERLRCRVRGLGKEGLLLLEKENGECWEADTQDVRWIF